MSAAGCLKSILVVTVAGIVLSGGTTYTQAEIQPVNDLPNPYKTIRNWGTLPDGRKWGPTSAVDIDRDGTSVWVAERCSVNSCAGSTLPAVLKFDASGKLLRSFGAGMFIWPHSIHADRDGNVWVVDARGANAQELEKFPDSKSKGHQIVKFSPEGKVLLTLGNGGVAGDPPDALNEPNDVVTAPNGDIFVADGHSGRTVARIIKYDRNGKFIKTWGTLGSAPGEFRTPHNVVFDSRGRLIVADRGNHRIQVFDQDGKFLEQFNQFSRTSGLAIDSNDILYAADSESNPNNHPGWRKGMRIGSARDGKVMFVIPGHKPDTPEDTAPEGVAVDAEGNVYGSETAGGGMTKYVKR